MTPFRPLPTDRLPRIAVLDDYMGVAHRLADWSRVTARAELTFMTEAIPPAEMASRLAGFEALCLLRERSAFPADLLRALPHLRAIAATGRQNRTLDHEAARDLGIAVMTTSGSGNGVYATVELAWGQIIALMRHIPEEAAAMRAGAWQTRLGNALHGRTIGLIGLGKLGGRMALIARSFGMEVLAWSPNLTQARAEVEGALFVSKTELLNRADVVSLHLVLGPTTRGVIGAAELADMKPGAILVNTARGPLVDTPALIEALRSGHLRGAGIDVFDHEPLLADAPIRNMPNALLTPHLGYSVEETFAAFYAETAENLENWLDGRPSRLAGA